MNFAPQPPITPDDLPRLQAKTRILADLYTKQAATAAPAADALRQFAELLTTRTDQAMDPVAARLTAWQNAFTDQLHQLLSQPPQVRSLEPR